MPALVKRERAPGLALEEVPVPEIGPNDVLMRVQRASICGTDGRLDIDGTFYLPTSVQLYDRLGLPRSTASYHLRQLREAGVTRARAAGTNRIVSVRREDLESRFPGLVDVILRDDA